MTNETFRKIRLWLGMTQYEFAEYIDVSYATVAGIDACNRKVSDRVATQVNKRFKATEEFLNFLEQSQKLKI